MGRIFMRTTFVSAIRIDRSDVRGYTYHSLVDGFEWNSGYSRRFGLAQVNFADPTRPRHLRHSADAYSKIIADRGILRAAWCGMSPRLCFCSSSDPRLIWCSWLGFHFFCLSVLFVCFNDKYVYIFIFMLALNVTGIDCTIYIILINYFILVWFRNILIISLH